MTNYNFFSVVSMCTALIATILGPYVAIKTARSQINANVISTNRAKRIETVRELLAGVIAQMLTFLSLRDEIERDASSTANMVERFERATRSVTVLELLLNTDVLANRNIVDSLQWCIRRMLSKDEPAVVRREVEERIKEIVKLSQSMLKREWNRVKRGG